MQTFYKYYLKDCTWQCTLIEHASNTLIHVSAPFIWVVQLTNKIQFDWIWFVIKLTICLLILFRSFICYQPLFIQMKAHVRKCDKLDIYDYHCTNVLYRSVQWLKYDLAQNYIKNTKQYLQVFYYIICLHKSSDKNSFLAYYMYQFSTHINLSF